jgi:hypothetical protein
MPEYSINTKHEASRVMQRIDSSEFPIAVFVKRGVWSATNVTSNLFEEAMKRRKDDLIGIYTKSAQIDYLQYDLFHAGVR